LIELLTSENTRVLIRALALLSLIVSKGVSVTTALTKENRFILLVTMLTNSNNELVVEATKTLASLAMQCPSFSLSLSLSLSLSSLTHFN
jgi:hypothetical protein